MAFKIMARTLLELGAELISSDGVALYELIKNSVDAGSRRVRINVVSRVQRSQFDELLEIADFEESNFAASRSALREALDDEDIDELDEEAAAELRADLANVRNKRQLEQRLWEWFGEHAYIEVVDTGRGMSLEDLDHIYLTIGTRSRQSQREELLRSGRAGAAPLGEKGVGRLSTMRLGEMLEVRTTRSGDTHEHELNIDWRRFSHSSDDYLEDVDIEPEEGELKDDPERSGTTVRVRGLTTDWSREKMEEIAGGNFARLIDPFEGSTANDLLRIRYNGDPVIIPEIDRRYLELAHGTCSARFEVRGGNPELSGVAEYILRGKRRTFRLGPTELISIAQVGSVELLNRVGPFDMEMWWFNRRLLTAINELGTQREIRDEVARWSGGLMLFRDGYRVNPYGGHEDDWLEIDKRAFRSKGYKLNRQQVVGRVRITWRNRGLVDQTNREGLTETPEKRALVAMLQQVLLVEFKKFIDREDKAARIQERTTLDNIEEKIESTEDEVRDRLRKIQRLLPKEHHHLIEQALRLIKELAGYLDEARELTEEVAQDRAELVHLAGVGLMVEFIMHELERTTSATLRTLTDIDRDGLDRSDAAAIAVLGDQLKTINKRVSNLDPISAARRQTKENFDPSDVIKQIVEGHAGKRERHDITVDGSYLDAPRWRVKAVRGMFIQIIENLLSNSFYWLIQQKVVEPRLSLRVTIDVDPEEGVITITDNGPGVEPASASEIFEAFVTRRPAGEGHGLGLYISREVARYHGWTLDIERAATVRPGRYNTFVLDMSGA
ncbi:MAG TPA: sensor histidine kinase [Allosphingosinicella sp.]|jgi:signal transduction histidine kinase